MLSRLLLLFFLVFSQGLHANFERYFKRVQAKSCINPLRNVDFIYMINLDQRPEKYITSVQRLSPYGICPYRFSAVNGWELSLETINELGVICEPWMVGKGMATCYPLDGNKQPVHEAMAVVGRNYFCHCMAPGPMGIILSHLSVLRNAYDSGYETIWVMEDDIEVIRDPQVLPEIIDQLDAMVGHDGWDLLFTDRDTKDNNGKYVPCAAFAWRPDIYPADERKFHYNQDLSHSIREIGARYGAYSMIVSRAGMKRILDYYQTYPMFLPFDMEYTRVPGIRLFTVIDDVVSTQPNAISDNGAPNYLKKQILNSGLQ